MAVLILVEINLTPSCCRPSPGMREAMATAEVGDDVFRDDPTVLRLGTVLSCAFTWKYKHHIIHHTPHQKLWAQMMTVDIRGPGS